MSFVKISSMTSDQLRRDQQSFLRLLAANADKDPATVRYAIYVKLAEGKFAYISDTYVIGDEADNIMRSPCNSENGFYGGAARCFIRTPNGTLAVMDERYHFTKPVPSGRTRREDDGDLMATLRREIGAEIWCFAKDGSKVFVPEGIVAKHQCAGLDFQCDASQELGVLVPYKHYVNEGRKQLELIGVWDARGLPLEHSFYYEDGPRRPGDGRLGTPVLALDHDGEVVGVYGGTQGFDRFIDFVPHEVFAATPELLA